MLTFVIGYSCRLTYFRSADRIQDDDDDDEEDILQSLDGAHTWLEDLGLDKSQFRSLDPNKVKLYPYQRSRIDTHGLYEGPVLCSTCTA